MARVSRLPLILGAVSFDVYKLIFKIDEREF